MATSNLGTLTLDLIAKTGGFEEGLDKAGRESKKAAKHIEKTFNKAGQAVKTAMKYAGVAVSAFGAVAVRSLLQTNTELFQLAKRAEGLNVSVKFLSGLKEQADDLGVGVQQLAVTFGTLNRQIATAKRGSKTSISILEQFGIDPKNVKSTEDAFLQIANNVQKYGLNAQRSGALLQLLSASGKDIVPILKEGSRAIREQNDAMAKKIGRAHV